MVVNDPNRRARADASLERAVAASDKLSGKDGVPPATTAAKVVASLAAKAAETAQVANNVASFAAGVASGGLVGGLTNALTTTVAAALDEKLAALTNGLSAMLPAFPAATLTSLALGAPHAHAAHPPSGPPPAPPIPFPPVGPIMLGTCLQVLINGKPAARCGDIGLSPTCMGLPPTAMYEIITGSSKVFIGGARAARAGIDITWHCKPAPSGTGARAAAGAAKAAANASKMAKIAAVAGKVANVASKVAQVGAIASQAVEAEAVAHEDSALGAAMGLSAAMMAAQMAADAAAMAASAGMGKDQPEIPPTGTPGTILVGSPNVLIGGLPLPSSMAIAQGLMKAVKGLAKRASQRLPANSRCALVGQPIHPVTGACVEEFLDITIPGPFPLQWKRHYDSRHPVGPLGWGFRHSFQRELRRTAEGIDYVTGEGHTVSFPWSDAPMVGDGFLLRPGGRTGEYILDPPDGPRMVFVFAADQHSAPLAALRQGKIEVWFHREDGRLAAIEALSGIILVDHDAAGRLVRLRRVDPDTSRSRALVTYTYDHENRLVQFIDALGRDATYAYDQNHRMIRRTDRRGYTFLNEYDAQGRCIRERGEDGLADCRVRYLTEARCAICTYADGATKTVFWDENQTITRIIEPSGGATTFHVGADGRVEQEVDPNGNITRYLYDHRGGHVGRQEPHGHVLPPNDEDPNPPDPLAYQLPETPIEWIHGRLLNRGEISWPSRDDLLLQELSGRIVKAVLRTDPARPPAPRPEAPSEAFDELGQRVAERDAWGRTRRWTYDAEGNVLEYQDRDDSTYRYTYESWNLLAEQTDPCGAKIRRDYNLRSAPTQVVDAGGTIHEFVYDGWDRLVEVRRHGRIKERYVYDRADNLLEKVDGRGQRLLGLEVGDGNLHTARSLASGEVQRFEYDERGRYKTLISGDLRVDLAHDEAGRLVRDHQNGEGVEHTFSDNGSESTCQIGRYFVRYRRDTAGVRMIEDPTGAIHIIRTSEDGGLVARELANGTIELSHFDGDGRCLLTAGLHKSYRAARWLTRFDYSAEGELSSVTDLEGQVTRYEYDAAHRLQAELLPDGTRREFVLDAAGNLLAQPGLEGVHLLAGNRLATANGEWFEYDERNSVISRSGPNRAIQYEYDALERLTTARIDGEPWAGEYDPFCRLIRRTWRGRTIRLIWDDFRLSAEETDSWFRVYIYPDETALVPFMFVEYSDPAAEAALGRPYFIFSNQIGAPTRIEDATGEVVWAARIDPYGLAHVESASTIEFYLRFPGHWFDPATELHFNRFRCYCPRLGRYLTSDPIGLDGGIHLYAYCPDPLTSVDLDGLSHARNRTSKSGKPKDRKGKAAEGDFGNNRSKGTQGKKQVDAMLREGSLVIKGDAKFQKGVRQDLYKVANTKTGGNSLNTIRNSGHTTTIQDWDPKKKPGNVCSRLPPNSTDAYPPPDGSGKGCASTVFYNPTEPRTPGSPADTGLNHELGHAANNATGTNERNNNVSPESGVNAEEYKNTHQVDNAYRRERGYPERPNYDDPLPY